MGYYHIHDVRGKRRRRREEQDEENEEVGEHAEEDEDQQERKRKMKKRRKNKSLIDKSDQPMRPSVGLEQRKQQLCISHFVFFEINSVSSVQGGRQGGPRGCCSERRQPPLVTSVVNSDGSGSDIERVS